MSLRLSEAIRLGAMLRPQAYGHLFRISDGTSCAFGAAFEARGIAFGTSLDMVPWRQWWTWLPNSVACPACAQENYAADQIVHLNNDHRWTRERIADWVAMVEPSEITLTPSVTDVTVASLTDHTSAQEAHA